MGMWDYDDIIEKIPYFIEDVYNKKRPHSSLEYMSSKMFENKLVNSIKNSCKIYSGLRY